VNSSIYDLKRKTYAGRIGIEIVLSPNGLKLSISAISHDVICRYERYSAAARTQQKKSQNSNGKRDNF